MEIHEGVKSKQMNEVTLIVVLIVASGLTGGIGNFFRFENNLDAKGYNLAKSIFLGTIAAFTVPLFLNMLSSDLLEFANTPTDYFVFVGFCLIAAFFSNRFMNSIGDKVIQDLEKIKRKTNVIEEDTKDNSEKVEALVEEQTDGGTGSVAPQKFEEIKNEVSPKVAAKIFESFKNEKYKFRTVEGIAKDSGLNDVEAKALIEKLEQKNIVKRYKGRGGKRIYSLTD